MLGFRVWNPVNKKMLYAKDTTEFICSMSGKLYDQDSMSAEPCIAMQSTGIQDKAGRFIYEGDFIKMHIVYDDDTIEYFIYLVDNVTQAICFIKDLECIGFTWTDYIRGVYETSSSAIEILGNKFEHSELLEQLK